jgi:hypothetical protein
VGRWSSDEFKKYIQIHPYILQALIHDSSSWATMHKFDSLLSWRPFHASFIFLSIVL